jgi:hypothetical protein
VLLQVLHHCREHGHLRRTLHQQAQPHRQIR